MTKSSPMMSIAKLIGRENWVSWSFAVKAYLQHEELYDCILTAPNLNKPESVKQDTKAKSKLILLIDPILYVHIQDAENAKDVWDNLARAFEDSGLTPKVGLLKELIYTNFENSSSVEEYVNKIMTAAHKLRNIKFNGDDEWLGTLMLVGLPEVYKPMIMGLESSGMKISAELEKNKLLQEIQSTESDTYWAEAVATAAYIINRSLTQAVSDVTPHEVWTGKKPDLSHMKVFGCNALVHIPKENRTKLNAKSRKLIFVGYSDCTKGYRFIDPETKLAVISRDVVFLEATIQKNKVDDVPEKETKINEQEKENNIINNEEKSKIKKIEFLPIFEEHVEAERESDNFENYKIAFVLSQALGYLCTNCIGIGLVVLT